MQGTYKWGAIMSATTTSRIILDGWIPPKCMQELQQEGPLSLNVISNPVEEEQGEVRTHYYHGSPTINTSGVGYQRCGGGRRIIRKRLGNN